jgi:hypothetical protein
MEPVDNIIEIDASMPTMGFPDDIFPLPSITYEWSGDRIDGLNKLLEWYSELSTDHTFSIQGIGYPVSVLSITRWLRAQIGAREYTESTREILNELVEIRRNWIYGNSRT